ncbi:MAG: glycosyltransferase family 39 protein, partial [Candidatus Omnitrophota bacterium]
SYIAQPWLQNYVCAASFLLFGESNTSARIIFALFGLLSFYLIYVLAYRLFEEKILARISVIIAATSVPFLLMLRQCRYYSLTVFLSLALLIFYVNFLERKKFSSIFFVATSFFLFHANFGCLIPLLGAIFVSFVLLERKRKLFAQFLKMYVWIFILLLPWAIIYKIWSESISTPSSLIIHNAKFYLSKVNHYFLPYRSVAIILITLLVFKWRSRVLRIVRDFFGTKKGKSVIFLNLICLVNWFFLWFADANSARYIIHVAPLLFIFAAFLIWRSMEWSKILAGFLLIVLCFSNLLHDSFFYVAAKPFVPLVLKASAWARDKGVISVRFDKKVIKEVARIADKANIKAHFFDYLYEITNDYDGPMEGVVKYLRQNAKPGETIKTHLFNANPLFYYTDLKVDTDFTKETYPEWIFLRDYWTEDTFYKTEYFKNIEKRYDKIELDYPDIWWENRPDDMSHHYFKTAPLEKKISLYRRK